MTKTLYHGATLIDGTGADPRPNASVLVEDGVIRRVGPGLAIEPFEHGSNIFPMRLAPDIDPDRLASRLAARSVFIYPRAEQYEGRTLLHVNTSILRQTNDRVFRAFEDALQAAGEQAKASD